MPCCWSSMSRDVILLLSGSKLCLAKLFRSNSFNSTARHCLIDGWMVQGAEEEVEDDEVPFCFGALIPLLKGEEGKVQQERMKVPHRKLAKWVRQDHGVSDFTILCIVVDTLLRAASLNSILTIYQAQRFATDRIIFQSSTRRERYYYLQR